MSIKPFSEIRDVTGITDAQRQRIYDFLQGAVYCWCKNKPEEWFTVRDLQGGENFDWNGTPLITLYDKHIKKGKTHDDAVKEAGKDAGRVMKRILHDDSREFLTEEGYVRSYKWNR
jgi:hypothetical protein